MNEALAMPTRPRVAWPWAGLATVVFLGVTAGVQMSDRGLQSILSPAIRETFGVGDAVIGALHGIAGILIASALAMPLARLADRHSRKTILLGLIAAWTALTLLGALAPNFPLFFVGRAAAGITEFAMIPIVYSLIPDLVGERWRVGANLGFAALMATGASAGFYLGGDVLHWVAGLGGIGWLADHDPWRKAMLVLALAGLPLLLAGSFTRDPPRHVVTDSAPQVASLLAFVRANLWQVLLFIGAAGGVAVAVQAVTPMAAMALVRRFSADLEAIGHTLGMLILVGNMASLLIAWGVDRALRSRFGARGRPAIMGVATAIAIPCAGLLAVATSVSVALALVGAFLLATCVANALLPTMLQDLAPVELRARAFAGYSFVIAAFCALGPVLSGGISQFLLADDLLSAMSFAAVPVMGVTLVCTFLWWSRS